MKRYHRRDFSLLLFSVMILLLPPTTAAAREGGPRPELAFIFPAWEYVVNDSPSRPAHMESHRGLLIEEYRQIELYPPAFALFFDGGSAEIASRYVTLTDPAGTAGFADTAIPGGTFQKYYQLLNIIGFRMRKYPDARITVTGCNSAETAAGETRELSSRRAENIAKYLTDIWGIDQSRIAVTSRGLPEIPSDRHDPLGIAENRRVEISSADWEIIRPVVDADFRRLPIQNTMYFQMRNGVPDSLVASREIEIIWDGKPWHVMSNIGIADSVSPAWSWARNGNPDPESDDFPSRSTPFIARLTVHLRDGALLHSDDLSIPVEVVEEGNAERDYTITIFGFRQTGLTALNRRVLREYVYPDIEQWGGQVDVMGYADIVEAGAEGARLSGERATAVAADIRATVKKSPPTTIRAHPMADKNAIYPNEFPEGRFYNRTVQVRDHGPDQT
ncbi:MAG: OmpA/MotB domain protein [Chlorobi bacterium]|nr:OmpA/MotB domain protein [Chlorobiota bacterium]